MSPPILSPLSQARLNIKYVKVPPTHPRGAGAWESHPHHGEGIPWSPQSLAYFSPASPWMTKRTNLTISPTNSKRSGSGNCYSTWRIPTREKHIHSPLGRSSSLLTFPEADEEKPASQIHNITSTLDLKVHEGSASALRMRSSLCPVSKRRSSHGNKTHGRFSQKPDCLRLQGKWQSGCGEQEAV